MNDQIRHGFEQPILRLSLRHFEGSHNGIVVIGTWCFEKRTQPCLVLLDPRRPISRGRTIPCIVKLEDAWRWSMHSDVGDPEGCSETVNDWLDAGALPGNKFNDRDKIAVYSAVNFFLNDLIKMPPAPILEQRVIGDMQVVERESGKVLDHREAKINV